MDINNVLEIVLEWLKTEGLKLLFATIVLIIVFKVVL